MKKKIVFFTGSGISAESGIDTYRDTGGIWSQYKVEEVATAKAWKKNPAKVLEFHNLARKQMNTCEPNAAHIAIAELEKHFDVCVITQNVDNLHERAGSTDILHLHGDINLSQSNSKYNELFPITDDIKIGDLDFRGKQLRHATVLFGEMPWNLEEAANEIAEADIVVICGTSLQVEPAASLISHAQKKLYLVDPCNVECYHPNGIEKVYKTASIGIPELCNKLISEL